jgi:hypothetical protein
MNFNQLRNQIHEDASPDGEHEMDDKLKIAMTYKLEKSQNRLLIEQELIKINDLLTLQKV